MKIRVYINKENGIVKSCHLHADDLAIFFNFLAEIEGKLNLDELIVATPAFKDAYDAYFQLTLEA